MYFTQRKLTLLSVAVLLLTGASWGQRGNSAIQVDVPFEFEVGHKVLPSGVYIIDHENPYILVIHDAHKRVVATVIATPAEMFTPSPAPKVQFFVDGGHNVLARIWNANSRYGYELSPRKRETTMARSQNVTATASSGR